MQKLATGRGAARPRRPRGRWGSVALLGLALAALGGLGCGDQETSPSFHYPLDDILRMNHLQVKATHNSYHVEPKDNIYDGWRYTHAPLDKQLSEQGVRGFELDIHYNFALGYFRVFHTQPDPETTCERLVDCLSVLKGWSDARPAHQPLFIMIEPKDAFGALDPDEFVAKLEGEILSVWPRERIVTPELVQGSAADMQTAITTEGWPTLNRVRGRALFALFWGDINGVKHYAGGPQGLRDRVMFINSKIGDPFGAVAIFESAVTEKAAITSHVEAGFLARVLADLDNVEPLAGDIARRDAALESWAHFVATDYPVDVAGVDYVVEIPDGEPSRCNAVTAASACSPRAIENPEFIQ